MICEGADSMYNFERSVHAERRRKCMTHRPETFESHQHAVQEVISFMRKDPSSPLDLSAMAAVASMSRYHFLRVFEEVTSITPSRFLAAIRMERAKRFLVETSLPVTSICFEVGYDSLGTFTRLFTDVVGLSPNSFRRLAAQLARRPIDELIAAYLQRQSAPPSNRVVAGSVRGPLHFDGVVFIGLFPSPIPQRRPINGVLLLHQGRFELGVARVGQPAFLMAVGFPKNSSSIAYLLPSQNDLLVGSSSLSSETSDDAEMQHCELILRRRMPVDPPILIALPLLLAD